MPRAVMIETADALMTPKFAGEQVSTAGRLRALGYTIFWEANDCLWYGVSQHRKQAVLVAFGVMLHAARREVPQLIGVSVLAIRPGRDGLLTMRPLSPEHGQAPMVGVRLPRELHERAIELAGDGRGALSAFVRQAVADALERDNGPPDGGAEHDP
jgi:site-specific DNA-cytosine methylase